MFAPAPPSNSSPLLTPSALNMEIRDRVSDLRRLRVRGEISDVRSSGGHLYFQIKDEGATLRCTAWRSTVARQRMRLTKGQQVICYGSIDLWVRGGTYTLIVQRVEDAGMGTLWAAFQKLKTELTAEGLFDPERRRPLPALPQTVGIVTAPTGAALRDMIRVLHERFPVRILLAPAKVQGISAAESVASAIELLDASGLCDVIVAGRGGGSVEDLWAFNEARVVRAFAACQTPIVSAVGHETDTLLSDHAADRRAPTPTAAAEMIVPRLDELQRRIEELRWRMRQNVARSVSTEHRYLRQLQERLGAGEAITGHRRGALDDRERRLAHAATRLISEHRRRLDTLRGHLHRAHPAHRLATQRRLLSRLQSRLERRGGELIRLPQHDLIRLRTRLGSLANSGELTARHRQHLARLEGTLSALSPRAALRRGYAIIQHPRRDEALKRASDVTQGDELQVLLAEGRLEVRVQKIRPNE